jgi:peroxiredoxin Q/BCP
VGISADQVDRQNEFATTNSLNFPLLSDPSRAIARQFGTKRFGPIPSKRATFVIDQASTCIAAITSETNMHTHADEALEVLRNR